MRGSLNGAGLFEACDLHFSIAIPLHALPTSAYTVSPPPLASSTVREARGEVTREGGRR